MAGGLVIVIVVVIIAVALTNGSSKAAATTPAPADVVQSATNVPASTLAAVGVPSGVTAPKAVTPPRPLLTKDGLPEVLYMGAEYCPYCAAERWAMVVSLSHFGKFANLGATESSTSDVYPGTKTFSFYGSSYSSPYLAFTPVEMESNQPSGNGYKTLQTPTAAQTQLLNQLDTSSQGSGGIPFIDFGNRYVVSTGSSYNPQVLQGLTMGTIAGILSDPTSPVAQQVGGTANVLTAAICQMTNNQPGSVCNTPTIVSAKTHLS